MKQCWGKRSVVHHQQGLWLSNELYVVAPLCKTVCMKGTKAEKWNLKHACVRVHVWPHQSPPTPSQNPTPTHPQHTEFSKPGPESV
jgi:hypothetical protein